MALDYNGHFLSNGHQKSSFKNLRIICFIIGFLEILSLTFSLLVRSELFNILHHYHHHIATSKDSTKSTTDTTIRYALDSALIFSAIRIGFEILQIFSGLCLCFGAVKQKYHLVTLNFQATSVYAVLSPVMWWEILYFHSIHLTWIVPLWIGILSCFCYFPHKLKNKLWKSEYHYRQDYDKKLGADLGVEAIG